MKSICTTLIVLLFVLSQPTNSQWKYSTSNVTSSQDTWTLAVMGEDVFAGLLEGGIYRSTDNGKTWFAANKGIEYEDVDNMLVNGSTLYATVYGKGVWTSTDKGASWNSINEGLLNQYVSGITISNTTLFAGTRDGGVYISTNNGTNWSVSNNGLTSLNVNIMAANGSNVYAGTKAGMFLSTNNGASWKAINKGLTETDIRTITISGSKLYIGTPYHIWLSTDNGSNWNPIGVSNENVTSIAVRNNNVFVGINGSGGIYLTMDNGANWSDVGSSLLVKTVKCLAMNSNYILAGTDGIFIHYRALNEMITTGVNDAISSVPTAYSLGQNYPNPFNPSTTINYTIEKEGFVKLSVYNTLGEEIAKVVNEWEPAGNYSVKFNSGNFSSGIYLYRLESGIFSSTRKFTVLK